MKELNRQFDEVMDQLKGNDKLVVLNQILDGIKVIELEALDWHRSNLIQLLEARLLLDKVVSAINRCKVGLKRSLPLSS